MLNDLAKNIILWVVIAIVLLTVFQSFSTGTRQSDSVEYSEFLDLVSSGQVDQVVFEGDTIKGFKATGDRFTTYSPETDNTALIGEVEPGGSLDEALVRPVRAVVTPRALLPWSEL